MDGLQRVTAALAFLNDEIPVFGCLHSEFEDKIPFTQSSFRFHIHNLKTRTEEPDRVRKLLEEEASA